jgi:hypothetical protein
MPSLWRGRRRSTSLLSEDIVDLRGTGLTIFRRTPGEVWRVDETGVRSVLDRLQTLGYKELERPWRVHSALQEYLLDLAYFFPGRTPGAGSALALALGAPPPPLAGETLEALVEPSFDRYSYSRRDREPEVLQDQRVSQREMEQLIRKDLEVEPDAVALRRLVTTTENAARAQWHYGMWGIYRRDTNRQPAELVAVYGHHKGGFGADKWHFIREQLEDDWNSWRPSLRDFAAIRCALTGRLLYEWGRAASTPDPRSSELFIQGPPDLSGLGEFDEVTLAEDPTEPPQLRVAK